MVAAEYLSGTNAGTKVHRISRRFLRPVTVACMVSHRCPQADKRQAERCTIAALIGNGRDLDMQGGLPVSKLLLLQASEALFQCNDARFAIVETGMQVNELRLAFWLR